LFLRFVEEYKAEHDLSNVFLLGFSQGAITAAVSSLTSPESVQGAICMSGRFPPEFEHMIAPAERLKQTSLFVTHGVEDLARLASAMMARVSASSSSSCIGR
jgi:phospholipase/carboxylesterase